MFFASLASMSIVHYDVFFRLLAEALAGGGVGAGSGSGEKVVSGGSSGGTEIDCVLQKDLVCDGEPHDEHG